ncbi:MAG: YkvA family protein [Chloroflexota bacterium]
MLERLKNRARSLKTEVYALYLAYRDSRVPLFARIFAACVVAYAFSPIDLIPDFIPVLGYLDDLILIPLGITIAIRMIPAPVMEECRLKAKEVMAEGKPVNKAAAAIIIAVWLLLAALCVVLLARFFGQ